jgi:hypothetical protein
MDDTTTRFIDITPVGMKTPEGIARVNKAMQEWENIRAEVANKTHHLLRDHFYALRQTLVRNDESDAAEDLDEIMEDCKRMITAQDEFLKAVAGR